MKSYSARAHGGGGSFGFGLLGVLFWDGGSGFDGDDAGGDDAGGDDAGDDDAGGDDVGGDGAVDSTSKQSKATFQRPPAGQQEEASSGIAIIPGTLRGCSFANTDCYNVQLRNWATASTPWRFSCGRFIEGEPLHDPCVVRT